jgi:hypothetical protein
MFGSHASPYIAYILVSPRPHLHQASLVIFWECIKTENTVRQCVNYCVEIYMHIPKIRIRYSINTNRRSQWPPGLRRRSAAVRLLGLWVRIPPGHGCLSLVNVVCCQVQVSASGWALVQRSLADCGVSKMSVILKPRQWGPGPLGAVAPLEEVNTNPSSKPECTYTKKR